MINSLPSDALIEGHSHMKNIIEDMQDELRQILSSKELKACDFDGFSYQNNVIIALQNELKKARVEISNLNKIINSQTLFNSPDKDKSEYSNSRNDKTSEASSKDVELKQEVYRLKMENSKLKNQLSLTESQNSQLFTEIRSLKKKLGNVEKPVEGFHLDKLSPNSKNNELLKAVNKKMKKSFSKSDKLKLKAETNRKRHSQCLDKKYRDIRKIISDKDLIIKGLRNKIYKLEQRISYNDGKATKKVCTEDKSEQKQILTLPRPTIYPTSINKETLQLLKEHFLRFMGFSFNKIEQSLDALHIRFSKLIMLHSKVSTRLDILFRKEIQLKAIKHQCKKVICNSKRIVELLRRRYGEEGPPTDELFNNPSMMSKYITQLEK